MNDPSMKTLPDEPLPEFDEDIDNAGQGSDGSSAPTTEQEDQERHPIERMGDERRDAITALYRQRRDHAEGSAENSEDDTSGEEGGDTAAPASPAAAPAVTPATPPDEIELIVDGQAVKKTLAEVKALAQINLAADNRLEEAKRLLREAKEARQEHQPAEPTAAAPQGEKRPEHQPAKDLDPDALTRIVERIQVGDAEEGRQALTELVGLVRDTAGGDRLTPEQVDNRVRQTLVAHQTQTEIDTAAKAFEEKYPQIAADQDFRLVGLDLLARELRADLKGIGLSDDDLRPLGSDVRLLATAHRTAKANGARLRSYGDVFSSVGDTITAKFNLAPKQPSSAAATQHQSSQQQPRNTETAADREARKREALQQPRTAGMRRPAPAQTQRPKTAMEKVQDMRKERGFDRFA